MQLNGKKIIVAVCGSIAAYKVAILIRLLVKKGANVKVVMTQSATDFISPLTLATLSKNECNISFTNTNKTNWNNHVDLALWADFMIIAPASANTIAKMANGICDNLLMAVYLSARCPIYISPAMDEDMWKHPSVKNNIKLLTSFGNTIIPVNNGELASGLVGEGRMAEPEEIIDFIENKISFSLNTESKLYKKNILITAGPTYEALDPVRFIGNHSSGKMGIALAEQAQKMGANVTLVLGPSNQMVDKNIHIINVVSGKQMFEACEQYFNKTDICIFAAAVADYTPSEVANQKIKKQDNNFSINLTKNIDIAYEFGKVKRENQIAVGFALETNEELKHAKEKIIKKNFNLVVLNSLNDKGAGFKHDTNQISIVDKHNKILKFELKTKQEVATDILNEIEKLF